MKTKTNTVSAAEAVAVPTPVKKNKKERRAERLAKAATAKTEVKPEGKASKTLTNANATKVVASITEKKDLKYIYPAECETGGSKDELLERRKKFRAGVRRTIASFEKKVKNLMSDEKSDQKEIDKVEKEYKKYAKAVYLKPNLVTA